MAPVARYRSRRKALEPRVLRKGIFTKDVEDQAAIAKRLSHAVNDGFAGTIAMASQSAQNAKRARELQKTMDSQQKRLQSVTEPFKGLSREQMDEILGMASRFREQNREEQLKNVPGFWEVQGKRRKTASARAGRQGR